MPIADDSGKIILIGEIAGKSAFYGTHNLAERGVPALMTDISFIIIW